MRRREPGMKSDGTMRPAAVPEAEDAGGLIIFLRPGRARRGLDDQLHGSPGALYRQEAPCAARLLKTSRTNLHDNRHFRAWDELSPALLRLRKNAGLCRTGMYSRTSGRTLNTPGIPSYDGIDPPVPCIVRMRPPCQQEFSPDLAPMLISSPALGTAAKPRSRCVEGSRRSAYIFMIALMELWRMRISNRRRGIHLTIRVGS